MTKVSKTNRLFVVKCVLNTQSTTIEPKPAEKSLLTFDEEQYKVHRGKVTVVVVV